MPLFQRRQGSQWKPVEANSGKFNGPIAKQQKVTGCDDPNPRRLPDIADSDAGIRPSFASKEGFHKLVLTFFSSQVRYAWFMDSITSTIWVALRRSRSAEHIDMCTAVFVRGL